MKILQLVVAVFIFSVTAFAQNTMNNQYNANNFSVQWEVVENNYKGKREFLSSFTLTSKGSSFPATGWKLYFNFPRMILSETVTGGMSIKHINGDFYELAPAKAFTGLAAGKPLRVEFVAGAWAINITDAPAGLYLVWDEAPEKGITISNYTVKPSTQPKQFMRYAGDKIELATPQKVYEQNKTIVDIPEKGLVKIFPTPVSYKEQPGYFLLENGYRIVTKDGDAMDAEKDYLDAELKKLVSGKDKVSAKQIVLQKTGAATDAYRLWVTPQRITISSGTNRGIFYGIQSLKTLIPPQAFKGSQAAINIPAVNVIDSPRFAHRAFLMDVGRNFQTKEQVFKVLDLMALYKLNVFHFHLTEDEGWRLEIPGLPELTTIGVRKGHAVNDEFFLHPSFGSGPQAGKQGDGFYTRQDFIEILRYAKQQHIQVIPEIEAPGHARAAIAAMTARYNRLMKEGKQREAEEFLLYHPADSSVYKSVQRWYRNVIDPSLPSTYTFLEKVTDEIIAMYKEAGAPLTTVHFGGDEVPQGVWKGSPAVHQLMKENKTLQTVDDLWTYFYGKVNELLQKRGLLLYGWEEIGLRKEVRNGKSQWVPNTGFAKNNVQVDVWNNVIGWGAEDMAYQLANTGYKVVLSPVTNLYFDLAYQKAFDEPGYYWGGYVDSDKPFYFIPFDYYKNATEDISGNRVPAAYFKNKERLTAAGKENIAGLQGALWSETLRTPQQMEYMLLPKLLALAERSWAKAPAWAEEKDSAKAKALYNSDWSVFVNTIGKRELPRLDAYAGGFQYRISTPGAVVRDGMLLANTQFPGTIIRYTTDGTEPTAASPVYKSPVAVKGIVKLKLFTGNGRSGRTVEIQSP